MLDLAFVEFSLFRLNARPFDPEAVRVKTRFRKKPDILFVPVVMIAGVAAGLLEIGVLHMLHGPVIGMYIIAFHLVRGRRRADQKFSHFMPP